MRARLLSRPGRIAILGIVGILLMFGLALLLRPVTPAQSAGLSPLETRVYGQSQWLSGGPAALRVIVWDHKLNAPVRARVSIAVTPLVNNKPKGKTYNIFSGVTGQTGTVDASFKLPELAEGAYQLAVKVDSYLGPDQVTQTIQVTDAVQILLSCDKPLYQPGQTIHLRALAMDAATM